MESRTSIDRSNFGLNSVSAKSDQAEFDNWFWESKAKKKIQEQQKQAEIERMRAETAAMQKILAEEQSTSTSGGMDVGKIALIGGAVILLGIGAVVILKKKKASTAANPALTAEDLMV